MAAQLSYHGKQEIKDKHVGMAKHHAEQEMLIAGTYGEGKGKEFKACSVGCFAHDIKPRSTNYHKVVADDAGWPLWLVYLNDRIFEGLDNGERAKFHVDLREAVPVGKDLEPVRHMIAIRRDNRLITLLQGLIGKRSDKIDAVLNGSIAAIEVVRSCHEAELGGNVCDWSAARQGVIGARRAAYAAADAAYAAAAAADAAYAAAAAADAAYAAAAAAYAAYAAAAAAYAAYAYADAAAYAYADAAADADAAYAAYAAAAAARKTVWRTERDDLLEVLRSL